jgi:hypothetical protein
MIVILIVGFSRSLTNVMERGAERDQCQTLLKILQDPNRFQGLVMIISYYEV